MFDQHSLNSPVRPHAAVRLLRLPGYRLRMLVEAAVWLLTARIAVRLVSFARIGSYLGPMRAPTRMESATGANHILIAKDVRWAVNAVANRSPAEMVCLPRALAAWRMLLGRGVPSRLHFGTPLHPVPGCVGLQTHAWLSSSGVEVTGYPVAHGCVEVGFFSREERITEHEGAIVASR